MTKIKICFTFLFFICVSLTKAQQTQIDSLKQKLKAEKTESIKLQILWKISNLNRYVSNDSMVFYAQQAVLLSIKSRNSLPEGSEAQALDFLAGSLWWAGNYPDAKESYLKALQIAEPLADTMFIGYIYNGIASVERNAGNYREAIKYYTKSENLTKHIPDNDVLLNALIDKGKSYEQLGILDSAYTYVQECLAMYFRKFQGKNVFGGGLQSEMGIIYSKMGKEQLAVEFFRQSIQLSSELNEYRLLARGYCEFAEHFDRFHQQDSAIYYATKGFLIDQQFNLLVQQLQASTLLTKLYKQENKIDSAFKYQQIMIDTREQVFSNEKINRLQTLDFNEKMRQQELASAIDKIKSVKEIERQKVVRNSFIGGFILVLLIAIIVFRSLQQNRKAKAIITEQKIEVEEKNRAILDSIEYALRIQTAILPPQKIVKQYLENSFILYKPKDIVAGDFYWMETVDDLVLFAACDCTGHGVPGAMVSVVCHNALNRAVREFRLTQPAAILDKTTQIVIENFAKSEDEIQDGMDISICALNTKTKSFEWSGANNSLYLISNGQLTETKADKQCIGYNHSIKPFTNHHFYLQPDTNIYLFTDGFADQFGGQAQKKLTKSRFRELLLSVQHLTIQEQALWLDKFITNYKKDIEQTDDILVIGVTV